MHSTQQQSAMRRADGIICAAAQCVAAIDDPRDRLARQVGVLQGEIRNLCLHLAYAEERCQLTDDERIEAARDDADDWKREMEADDRRSE